MKMSGWTAAVNGLIAPLLIALTSPTAAAASTVLANNFDNDSALAGWTFSTDDFSPQTNSMFVSGGRLDVEESHPNVPGAGSWGIYTGASTSFVVTDAGNYSLAFDAFTTQNPLTDHGFQVLVDNVVINSGSSYPPDWYSYPDEKRVYSPNLTPFVYTLTDLGPGTHVLSLELFVGLMYNGTLDASFDNLSITKADSNHSEGASPVPELGTWAMMLGGFGALGASLRNNRYRLARA